MIIFTLDNDDSNQNKIFRTDSALAQIMQHVDCFAYSKIPLALKSFLWLFLVFTIMILV